MRGRVANLESPPMDQPAPSLRVALAQINPTVGDVDGNERLIADAIERAAGEGAGLVVCPELCLPGYPAEDLYLKPHFGRANAEAIERLAAAASIPALVGFAEPVSTTAERRPDAPGSRPVHNSLALLDGGRVAAVYRKNRLPNYGVFDEVRYFEPGSEPMVVEIAGVAVGLTICEDLWEPGPPASSEAESGARLIVNPSGSPYLRGKGADRERMFAERARAYGVPIAFCNLVGGQDELVFDGHSFVVGADGELLARAPQFRESLLLWELGGQRAGRAAARRSRGGLGGAGARPRATTCARTASSGCSSASRAASTRRWWRRWPPTRSDAERVGCVVMPSPHSSPETQADARTIATNLGAELIELPIGAAMDAYDSLLGEQWSGAGLAAENVQARIRGNLLMALSNDRGSLVLTTGNKSEMSVGYATLYGDMAGGLAVIKDVPKQLVYRLAGHANERAGRELVPASIIERPPSAELRPDQRDDDSLPPYDLLDRVLEGYVERDLSRDALIDDGTPAEVVDEVIAMVDRAEYKRRQAPPGIRITAAPSAATGACRSPTASAASAAALRGRGGPRSSAAPGRRGGPRRR